LLTAVGWPLLALLGVLAYPAIRLIYGDQWLAAVTLAQILCAAAAVELLQTLSREALLAKGQARRANALQIQLVLLQVTGLTLVFPYGLAGAAWGWMGANLLGLVVAQWHLDRGIGLGLGALSRAVVPSAVMAVVTAGPLALVAQIWPIVEGNYLRWGLLGGASGLMLWLLAARTLRHPLWDEISGLGLQVWSRLGRPQSWLRLR
jgi:O-antigen/teichoic acid export membrane protein